MKEQLAIFDLDGTLFDTTLVNFKAYQAALYEERYSFELADYKRFNGQKYSTFLPIVVGNNTEIIKKIHSRKKDLYPDFLSFAKINKHLFNIIDLIAPKYIRAIVTSASTKNCHEILDYFNVREKFDLIITQDDVMQTKPNPEGFLLAMNKFSKTADETIIFEDSPIGIEAARKTGASVFVVNKL